MVNFWFGGFGNNSGILTKKWDPGKGGQDFLSFLRVKSCWL